MGAVKFDDGKAKLSLFPVQALYAGAKVFAYGTEKYGPRNYLKGQGLEYSRVMDAALRHLFTWFMGEHRDPESGLPHLWHALANVAILVTYEQEGVGIDDRPFLDFPQEIDDKEAVL